MFCYIHEGRELVKGADRTIQYIDGCTIIIEIMSSCDIEHVARFSEN